ncbi:MarR family transcriptional regulator [Lutibacter sp. TH_r2]|uniref:MarR family winged helix-turn-helix transcriptional regulator n=1 Tax=Lutibacter sp. TH_r2 TaxID=3082083 RepID=UPI0029531FFF|nr:MarR family transcriptional regulator [Lutibacter sp. TH_r2]MDV7188368.1 MarR family transcriptional regulator [Lutibacter sp. TH_r2]
MSFEDNLIPWIGKTGKLIGATLNKILKDKNINLTREQFVILKLLKKNNGIPQHDLAFITESDKTSLSRLISNMEKNNLLIRKSTKEDKRIKNVYLTEFGLEIFKITEPIILESIQKFQKGITDNEINQAIQTISKLQNNIIKEHSIKLCDKK